MQVLAGSAYGAHIIFETGDGAHLRDSIDITGTGDILPIRATGTQALGSSPLPWADAWIKDVHLSGFISPHVEMLSSIDPSIPGAAISTATIAGEVRGLDASGGAAGDGGQLRLRAGGGRSHVTPG